MYAYQNNQAWAKEADAQDPLKNFRAAFHIPTLSEKPAVYFTGNSLGAMPKSAREAVEYEFAQWQKFGVEGHFEGQKPWKDYHKFLTEKAALVVGGKPHEVVIMNNLTVNLHLMMVSFFQPTPTRYKIIMEGGAFPSDQYAMETQVKFHGLNPDDAIIELKPRAGEHLLHEEDIIRAIENAGDSLALVMIGGVNYYTGQWYPMKAITGAGHKVGAKVGFDLAHAAGNVPMELHNWGVDFAVWCTYKYLNSGPGGTSGVFVHERHAHNTDLPRFAGWWGHKEDERFQMKKGFIPMYGAEGWQLSNAQIFPMAIHLAALNLFEEAGMEQLRAKSLKLTGYLEWQIDRILAEFPQASASVISPRNPAERGCQISLLVPEHGRKIFEGLMAADVITDWREPNVIRMAPVPIYNSFEDIFRFATAFEQTLKQLF